MRDHSFPDPSAGHPGVPSVPLMSAEELEVWETTRRQLGWFGSEYEPLKSTALATMGAVARAAETEETDTNFFTSFKVHASDDLRRREAMKHEKRENLMVYLLARRLIHSV